MVQEGFQEDSDILALSVKENKTRTIELKLIINWLSIDYQIDYQLMAWKWLISNPF